MAITIIPIPPNHCKIARQNKIAFGESFKFNIIVEPVVVIPDMLSKNESVNVIFKSEKMNGNDPKIAIVIHERAVRRNA